MTDPQPMSAGTTPDVQPATPADVPAEQPAALEPELEAQAAAQPRLVSGDCGQAVAQAAQLLAGHGFANPVAAGTAPPMHSSALEDVARAFQRARGLAETGVIDALTWAELLREPAPKEDETA